MSRAQHLTERYDTVAHVFAGRMRRHPYMLPVLTFLILFVLSSAAFINMGGRTIGASDSRVVHVVVDGREQTVPTRAATVGELLKRLDIEVREGDELSPAKGSAIIKDNTRVTIARAQPVTIIDEGKKLTTRAANNDPAEVAAKAGLTVYPEDKVELDRSVDILRDGIGKKVVINRATPASINLYGTSVPVRTHAKTVGEVLAEKDIKTGDGDTVQPSPETLLTRDTQIFVVRFGKKVETKEEPIPAPTETTEDPAMPSGTTQVRSPGSPGRKLVTYELEMRNGREAGRRVLQEVIAVQPVKRVVVKGSKVVISNPSENVKIGERLAAERGWTGQQWLCLYQLWQKESRWNHLAHNRNSGAYGIPQALPGTKMATAGADWQTNPATQIRWGLGYIGSGRYKTPCAAWSHSQSVGWY